MFKKILVVLLILAPSALYLSIASSGDKNNTEKQTATATEATTTSTHQTPDH